MPQLAGDSSNSLRQLIAGRTGPKKARRASNIEQAERFEGRAGPMNDCARGRGKKWPERAIFCRTRAWPACSVARYRSDF